MKYKELLEYHVPLGLPASPTLSDEFAIINDDNFIYESANLTPSQTGLTQGYIFISTMMSSHASRVKFYMKVGRDQPSYSVSISSDPKVVANSLPERIVNKTAPEVFLWVKQNHQALQNFWDNGTEWDDEQVTKFKSGLIPYRGKKGKKNE